MINSFLKKIAGPLTLLLILASVFISNEIVAQQETTYEQSIEKADKYFASKKYLDAKAYYQMALKHKPDDPYAKTKIETIVEKLKAQMASEEEYYEVIDLADVFFDEMAYDKAMEQYQKSLSIIPGDEYANERIAEIKSIRNREKEKLDSYAKAMETGNDFFSKNDFDEAIKQFQLANSLIPEREEPVEKIKLSKQMNMEVGEKKVIFDNLVEEAGRYVLIKNYATALELYEKAQALFPTDPDILAKIEEIKPQAKKQQAYNTQVEVADELYIAKDFISARSKYEEAGKAWPENSYPKDMISRIDEQMAEQRKYLDKNYLLSIRRADSLLALNEYNLAKGEYNLAINLKPTEKYPQSKLNEIEAHFANQQKDFEANYSKMIGKADSLFDAANYSVAKGQYEFALTIKPEDPYPSEKIAEIEEQLVLLEEQKLLDATYLDIITEADKLFNNGHYDLAIKKYEEAQNVKSLDSYPLQRITEIKTLLRDAEAQQKLDEDYAKLILLAVRLLKEDNLVESKKAYENALAIKPEEDAPKQQIIKIDSITTARINEAETQKVYLEHLSSGNLLLEKQEFDQAIEEYQRALEVKPGGIEADEKLLTARTMKRNHERAIARQETYDNAIKEGDRSFANKNYELAKVEYENASQVKPEEAYPKEKISELVSILKQLEAEKEQRYAEAVTEADNYYNVANYRDALIQYKIANSIKPGENHTSKRIDECTNLIEEQMRKFKTQYDEVIAEADKYNSQKVYDKAILNYQNAKSILPNEPYPDEMITKITKYIEDNAITDVVKETITIKSGVTEKFAFEPIKVNVRKTNYILVKAKNLSAVEFKIIFNFGSSGSKNGGFVIQVPNEEGSNDFIIRVGNQYKWFSEDNNWFTIYPENGDIEIELVRISTSN